MKIINNRFKIIKEIGRGGFGVVYLGEDLTNSKEIAIKKLYIRDYYNCLYNYCLIEIRLIN